MKIFYPCTRREHASGETQKNQANGVEAVKLHKRVSLRMLGGYMRMRNGPAACACAVFTMWWQGTRQLFRPVIGRVSSRNSCRALCGKCIAARCFPPTLSTVRIPHHLVSGKAVRTCLYSTPAPKLSSTERIKVVLREYGTVAVVFHTVISLASLGTCYLVVDR